MNDYIPTHYWLYQFYPHFLVGKELMDSIFMACHIISICCSCCISPSCVLVHVSSHFLRAKSACIDDEVRMESNQSQPAPEVELVLQAAARGFSFYPPYQEWS